jgi:hypothetical protein
MAGIEEAKEYFKRLKQAETHCGGDVELAKKLLAGDYRDAIVFKGRFKDMDDEIYGLFIVIVSRYSPRSLKQEASFPNSPRYTGTDPSSTGTPS